MKNCEGLNYVVPRHNWYLGLSELLFRDYWKIPPDTAFEQVRSNLYKRILDLYKSLLRYQMKSVCAYYKHRRILTFIQDQAEWNDWEGDVSEIKTFETSLFRDATQYNDLVSTELKAQHLDATLLMLDDATRSKVNKLISAFSVPGLNCEEFMNIPNKPPAPDTCHWFKSHSAYSQWKKLSKGALVISTPPGCGKSVLSRSLVHELRAAVPSDEVVLHFFFKDVELQNQATFALCSILHQLFTRRGDLILPLRDDIEQSNAASLQANLTTLWSMFVRSIADIKVICILDGLDECEPNSAKLFIDFIVEYLHQPFGNAKFIVTCRPYEEILQNFRSFQSLIMLKTGDEEISQISSEIKSVIGHRLEKMTTRERNPLPIDVAEKLQVSLKAFNNRTYLWLHLVFELLERQLDRREEAILGLTRRIPRNVEEAYSILLSRIPPDSHEAVHEILSILVAARRPLTSTELHTAHNAYLQVNTGKVPTTMNNDEFNTWLENMCSFFIQIFRDRVYFIHQTVKEYLLAADNWKPSAGISLGRGCITVAYSHRVMAEACILYLSNANAESTDIDWPRLISSVPKRIRFGSEQAKTQALIPLRPMTQLYNKYQFLEYSSGYWAYHHHCCQTYDGTGNPESLSDIRQGLWPQYFALFDSYNSYTVRSSIKCPVSPTPSIPRRYWHFSPTMPRSVSDLVLGVECGHWRMVLRGIANREDMSIKDATGRSLLDIACENDDVPMIRLLLRQRAPFDISSRGSPLLLCRSREAALLLLNAGAAITVRDSKGNTVLHHAARGGHVTLLNAFLERVCVDASWTNNDGNTPLHEVKVSTPRAIDLLVKAGCPIKAQNHDGDSVLHCMASHRSGTGANLEAAIRLGADVSSQNKAGSTPLHVSRSAAAVECLMAHGADASAINKDGRTPFDTVLMRGGTSNGAYAALLFASRKEMPNEPVRGVLPLFAACGRLRDNNLVMKFLEAGADPHAPDSNGIPFLQYYLDTMPVWVEVVERLLSMGVKPEPPVRDGPSVPAPWRYSTLDLALGRSKGGIMGDGSHVVPLLRLLHHHGADFKAIDGEGKSSLHIFAHIVANSTFTTGSYTCTDKTLVSIAEVLLEHGPAVDTADMSGSTPLHDLWRGRGQWDRHWRALFDICSKFLTCGAKPNYPDDKGDTPFTLVVQLLAQQETCTPDIREDILRLFLDHAANANAVINGRTSVLSIVCIGCHRVGGGQGGHAQAHVQMARQLLDSGAKLFKPDSKDYWRARAAPLMKLCNCSTLNTWSEQLANLLLDYNADPETTGWYMPLHQLLKNRLFGFWVEAGYQPSNDDESRRNATVDSMQRIALELVRRGASPTAPDPRGDTPLDYLKLELRDGPVPGLERLQKIAPSKASLIDHCTNNETIWRRVEVFRDQLLKAEAERLRGVG
jgi:ankyrin repeat protein